MINSNSRNIIVIIIRCAYHHPSIELIEFNNLFFHTLSKKLLSEKNKEIVLMGHFNMVGLLNYEKDHNTEVFLGQIYSTSLVPYITAPNRIT